MADSTPNIGLRKPLESDFVSVDTLNQNMEKIDEAHGVLHHKLMSHWADFETHVNQTTASATRPHGLGRVGTFGVTRSDTGLDTILVSGWSAVNNNSPNAPFTGQGTLLTIMFDNTAAGFQLFNPVAQGGSNAFFARSRGNSNWGVWHQLISSAGGTMTNNLSFSNHVGLRSVAGNEDATLVLADFLNSTTATVEARIFRYTNTSGDKRFFIYRGDGSANAGFAITNGEVVVVNGQGTKITAGTGSPEGVVTANPGSIYLNRSGGANTSFYVKHTGTGNTGWTAK
ncbi:hypothetical protein ACF3MZ_29275 [Paenibacillaceae bacterium WGS1546]|uniref:hypothetical protein n=1 Tax=Cohnella sp. WGS1546 TaxID=3366810 RepID=UPI00372D5FEF